MTHFHLNVYSFLSEYMERDSFGFGTREEALKEQGRLAYKFRLEGYLKSPESDKEQLVFEAQQVFALGVAPSEIQAFVLTVEEVEGEDCNNV